MNEASNISIVYLIYYHSNALFVGCSRSR